jgi:hypothetical protein
MNDETLRVIFDNRPYLVKRADDGSIERAFGPFTPGTEPNLAECGPDVEVRDKALLAHLQQLLPISPVLPGREGTLAGG